MIVRSWEEKDLDEILVIERSSFKDPFTREMLVWDLNGLYTHTFLIEEGGQVCGYASMMALFEDAEVGNVAVAEAFRGRGYGKILMEAMHEKARSHSAERMLLEVRPSNTPARRLYEGLGYIPVGLRKGYYADGEDAIVMEKKI